jgi:hypothetical protein
VVNTPRGVHRDSGRVLPADRAMMSHTGTYSSLASSLAWIAAMGQPGWHGWPVLASQHWHGAGYSTRSSSSTAWFLIAAVVVVVLLWSHLLEVLRRLGISGPTRWTMVSNCTSACCTSHLADGN